jgi:hypothetical protein
MERRKEVDRPKAADCSVKISNGWCRISRTITAVSPCVPDRNYTLSVACEPSTSRWRRDRNGWGTEPRWSGDDRSQRLHVAAGLRCIRLAGLSGILHRTGGPQARADDRRRGLADVAEGAGTGAGYGPETLSLGLGTRAGTVKTGRELPSFPTRQERSRLTSLGRGAVYVEAPC